MRVIFCLVDFKISIKIAFHKIVVYTYSIQHVPYQAPHNATDGPIPQSAERIKTLHE